MRNIEYAEDPAVKAVPHKQAITINTEQAVTEVSGDLPAFALAVAEAVRELTPDLEPDNPAGRVAQFLDLFADNFAQRDAEHIYRITAMEGPEGDRREVTATLTTSDLDAILRELVLRRGVAS